MMVLLPISLHFRPTDATMIAQRLTSDGPVQEALQQLLQFALQYVEMDMSLDLKLVTMETLQMILFVILHAQVQLMVGIVMEVAQ